MTVNNKNLITELKVYKILIVDDEPMIMHVIKTMLLRMGIN